VPSEDIVGETLWTWGRWQNHAVQTRIERRRHPSFSQFKPPPGPLSLILSSWMVNAYTVRERSWPNAVGVIESSRFGLAWDAGSKRAELPHDGNDSLDGIVHPGHALPGYGDIGVSVRCPANEGPFLRNRNLTQHLSGLGLIFRKAYPGVARASQPWAEWRNPFGI
jgi:hypothetical protein